MSVEAGDKVICIWDGEAWEVIEGYTPVIGEKVLCQGIQGNPKYAVMGLGTFESGAEVFIFPGGLDFDFQPFTMPPLEFDIPDPGPDPEDPWDWDEWAMTYGFYASHGGYYLIDDVLETGAGKFGIYLYVNGHGCWSAVSKTVSGTYDHLELDFIVSPTTVPEGKYTEIQVDGQQVYREAALTTGQEQWVMISVDIPETTNPTVKIICDCPVAYHGEFSLTIANLRLS